MYDIKAHPLSELIPQLLIFLGIFLVFCFFISLMRTKNLKETMEAVGVGSVPAIILLSAVGYFMNGMTRIDYAKMRHDQTNDYWNIINHPGEIDTSTQVALKLFMDNNNPQVCKDSLKMECGLISQLMISGLKDMVNYISLSSSAETFSISNATMDIQKRLSFNSYEKELADSCVLGMVRNMNNENDPLYAQIKMAKGFAMEDQLTQMQNGLIQYQDYVRRKYKEIFNGYLP